MGNTLRSVLLGGIISILSGCTSLVSEKPVFEPADYDTSGSLAGHYRVVGDAGQVVITANPDGRLTLFGFQTVKAKKRAKDNTETRVQALYADAAAIPVGNGDYALQISCAALADKDKDYASWLGGKDSRWRDYSAYGVIAQDRQQDHLWFSANFYRSTDELDRLFDRYGVKPAPDSRGIRILPAAMSRSAAGALFRDLIAREMAPGGGGELFHREDREGRLTADEEQALRIKDSTTCRRLQREGERPPDK